MSDTLDQLQAWVDDDKAWEGPATFDDFRRRMQFAAEAMEEWHGYPMPLDNLTLRLHDRHPLREVMARFYEKPGERDVSGLEDGEQLVNWWRSRKRQCEVYVIRGADGKSYALTLPVSPDGSMRRLSLWLRTIGASDAWDEAAERTARFKLAAMLTPRQWRHYDLTGSFLETSKRSGITYVFRRLRPTIALTQRWPERAGRVTTPDTVRCLAVLCLHPLGYYDSSWGGCMVPSDDVIAHLLMLRADEAHFWSKANQHDPAAPEAGL